MKKLVFVLLILSFSNSATFAQQPAAQEPFKLNAEENVQGQPGASYPAPQMMAVPGQVATPKPKKKLNGQVGSQSQSSPPIKGNVAQESFSSGITAVQLPPAFLGVWQVRGQRTQVEALPEFQAAAQQAFTLNNDQLWSISGSQGNYTLGSNTGISTALYVDKVQGNTAFVRYQHPIKNTMAQEAIVMSLSPSGAQFEGLERISIVKQGMPQPRAKVTYQLFGNRQQ